MPQPPTLPEAVYYFCDESSQVGDDWLAVAGVALAKEAIPTIARDLVEIHKNSPKNGEIKWDNAKSWGGVAHKAYVDYMFGLVSQGTAHFHIRFSPMNEYDHGDSGPRKRTDTVSKSFYQLLLHRAFRYYGGRCPLQIYPDDGDCTAMLPGLAPGLVSDARRLFGGNPIIREIVTRDSSREPILQMLDVTLGALAAIKNDRHSHAGANQTRVRLMDYVMRKTGWRNLDISCPINRRPMNRWIVTPKYKRGQRR